MAEKTGSKGGLLVGKSHADGGIKVITPEGKLEVEGDEIILTKGVYQSKEKVGNLITPDMTKREAASALNESENGVKIAEKGTKIETASQGAKISNMENLYYLQIGNILISRTGDYYKIIDHLKIGVAVKKHDEFSDKHEETFIEFNELFEKLDTKKVTIENKIYENERDRILLNAEKNIIQSQFDREQLLDKLSSLKKSHEDTMGGIEAMAAKGGRVKVGGIIDDAWEEWRLGGGNEPEDFDKWLVENPIGKTYLQKIRQELNSKLKAAKGKKADELKIIEKGRKDGWIMGEIGDYEFEAKVYEGGSRFGIDFGQISKLYIREKANTRKVILNYDRGWDVKPTKENEKYLNAIVEKYDISKEERNKVRKEETGETAAKGAKIGKPLSFEEWMEEKKQGANQTPYEEYKEYLKLFNSKISIPNNYEGKTPEQVWNLLTPDQRHHFMHDHFQDIPTSGYKNSKWNELHADIRKMFETHHSDGQYKLGGKVESGAKRRMAEFFRIPISNLKDFKFDGTDNIPALTKAVNSTNDAGTENYYKASIRLSEENDEEYGEMAAWGTITRANGKKVKVHIPTKEEEEMYLKSVGDIKKSVPELLKLTKSKGVFLARFKAPSGGKNSKQKIGDADVKTTKLNGKTYAKTITFTSKNMNRKEALDYSTKIAYNLLNG